MTTDHFTRIASLESQLAHERGLNAEQAAKLDLRTAALAEVESALAEVRAKTAEDTYHLELLLDAEKASHTDTLVKLRLTEERLAASEAERERWQGIAETRKRDSVDAEQALYQLGHAIIGGDSVPGDYERLLSECGSRLGDWDEALDFLREHGDAIESMLRIDSHADALADELAQLLLRLDGCPGTVMTPDEYMSADHDDEPTVPMATKEPNENSSGSPSSSHRSGSVEDE